MLNNIMSLSSTLELEQQTTKLNTYSNNQFLAKTEEFIKNNSS